jgi:hypothetical protein
MGRDETSATRGRRGRLLGARYGAASVALAALAAALGGVWLLALWPAIAVGVVGCAYATGRPRLLGKVDGRISLASRLLLAPYRAGARATWRLHGRDAAPVAEVVRGLAIGARPAPRILERLGVGAVVDMTCEVAAVATPRGVAYLNVPALDLVAPSAEQLAGAVAFATEHRARGVYVHCVLGRGRSAAVAAACLLAWGEAATIEEAVAMVRRARPDAIFPSDGLAAITRAAAAMRAAPLERSPASAEALAPTAVRSPETA